MKNYHPKSWSQQARELGERTILNVNRGSWSIDMAMYFLRNSYRHPLVRFRAAARFRRALLNGRIHEHPSSIQRWNQYKEKWEYRRLVCLSKMNNGF